MRTRRSFLGNAIRFSAGTALSRSLAGWAEATAPISLALAGPPVEIPANFTGLGYEMSSVSAPGLLRTTNRRYVNLVRGLGATGVLRVGGIVANYTSYQPGGVSKSDRLDTVITRADIEQFAAFLSETGWNAIWSVNFAQGTLDQAIAEARAVHEILGARLLALEIGNEVDTYGRGQPFRTAQYSYADFCKEFAEWQSAIAKVVPGIPFAAPDTARSVEWVERMAADAKGDVQLLTTHYYRNGQKQGSADQLLAPDPRLQDVAARLRTTAAQSGIPWRMCEINSFSGGGRPGVSDTFIGALWTLDTMLYLAQSGCAGVNMETGVNQLGFVSSYSPIQDNGHGINSAGVPYYGMLAFAVAARSCHQIFPAQTSELDPSMSAYMLGAAGKPRSVVLVNRSRSSNKNVSLESLPLDHPFAIWLTAPSGESTSGVTLGNAAVDELGRWRPVNRERVHGKVVAVPPMTAIIVQYAHPVD
jgi:hypothetical protein